MVTQGQGLSKRDFEKILEGARLVAEQTNLKRCASVGHMSPDRAQRAEARPAIQRVHHNVETARSYYDEVTTTVRYEGRIRTIDAVEEAGLETCVGGILNLGETPAAAGRDGVRARRDQPDLGADQPAEPAERDQVRRPRADGRLGGREVGGDLPPDPPRRALPPLRRAGSRTSATSSRWRSRRASTG